METSRTRAFVGLIAAILVTTSMGFASIWGWHRSSDRTTDVSFSSQVKFKNGKTLPAGTYQMQVPEKSSTPIVEFSQYGKVMATAKAKVVGKDVKNPYTEVDSTRSGHAQLVTEIRPSGWKEVLLFSPTSQTSSSKATK
jgi:flagellar hook assembly protein FlgD